MPSSFSICRSGRATGLRFELLARNYRAIAEQVSDELGRAVRCADRRAGRRLQHADPSARSARDRGPRRQRTGGSGRADRAVFGAGARSASTICSRRRRSTACSGSCWKARSGTTSAISAASSRPISRTASPARCCCRSPTRSGSAFPDIARRASAVAGLGLQGPAGPGGHRRPCRRCRRQRQFLGHADASQPQSRARRAGRLPRAAARDWEIKDYDADQERIVTFLEQNADDSLVVPYRENRAVLFSSRLFHRSDAPEFAPGYENHRINLTLLFG